MDWTGQKLTESLCIYLTLGFGLLSFIIGYAMQDFGLMMKVYGAGIAVTGLATIPDWPWLNRNPLTWLPVEEKEEEGEEGDDDEAGKKKGKATKKAAAAAAASGDDDEEEEGGDGGVPSSSPSLRTTTRKATTQRRQPVIE